jgi:hypothetical protein
MTATVTVTLSWKHPARPISQSQTSSMQARGPVTTTAPGSRSPNRTRCADYPGRLHGRSGNSSGFVSTAPMLSPNISESQSGQRAAGSSVSPNEPDLRIVRPASCARCLLRQPASKPRGSRRMSRQSTVRPPAAAPSPKGWSGRLTRNQRRGECACFR